MLSNQKKSLLTLAVCAFSNTLPVFASDITETVYVSATRQEIQQLPIATQIKIVSAEDIRLSGATTITEVLRSQAGIQIQDLDGSGGRNVTVSMRGFSGNAANNALVLVNGRKLNNPTLASPALNTVAVNDIDRIEIIQGSAGVLFGDQAVGGVINVITKKAKAGEIHAVASASKGSFGLERYTASINQGFESGLSYSLSAQKRNTDNFRDNNRSETSNVLGNIAYQFESGSAFVERQSTIDSLGLPGYLYLSDAIKNPQKTDTPFDFSNQRVDINRLGGQYDFTQSWTLLGEYSERDEVGNSLYKTYDYFTEYDMTVKSFTPRVVGKYDTAHGAAIVTLGVDSIEADYTREKGSTHIAQNQNDIYAQVVYPISKSITVNGGLRHSKVDDKNFILKKEHSDSINIGELGLNYQIDSEWRVFARHAGGYRFANADENGYVIDGVDFLNTQKSRSLETGFAWSGKEASVKYSLFKMNVDNEIMYDPKSGKYGANINLPTSTRKGLLVDGDVKLSDVIALHGNYTYTDAELTSGNFSGKDVPFVAKDSANIGVIFNVQKNLHLSVDANYTGSRYLIGDNTNSEPKLDATTLFNVNLLWDIKDLEVGFLVKNVTNEHYADYQGTSFGKTYLYPQPGRNYTAHVAYRF